MALKNPEQTAEEDHPSADGLENTLGGWLLELVAIWSPRVHLFFPPRTRSATVLGMLAFQGI